MNKIFMIALGLFATTSAFAYPTTPAQLISALSSQFGSQAGQDGITIKGQSGTDGATCSGNLKANGKQIAVSMVMTDANGNNSYPIILLDSGDQQDFSDYTVTNYENTPSKINFSLHFHVDGYWGKTDWGWPAYNSARNEDSSAAISLNAQNQVSSLTVQQPGYPAVTCTLSP